MNIFNFHVWKMRCVKTKIIIRWINKDDRSSAREWNVRNTNWATHFVYTSSDHYCFFFTFSQSTDRFFCEQINTKWRLSFGYTFTWTRRFLCLLLQMLYNKNKRKIETVFCCFSVFHFLWQPNISKQQFFTRLHNTQVNGIDITELFSSFVSYFLTVFYGVCVYVACTLVQPEVNINCALAWL